MILAIDQGTTGTTCLVVDDELVVRGRGYVEIDQHYPHPGWVEHDAEEIVRSCRGAAEAALADARVRPADLRGIGITNQRETTVLWERATGRPVQRAIVWQDRRTAERCRVLPADRLRELTGLVPDPYFSATKLEWLLARHDGDLAFGTIDSWLVWKLTGGRVHVSDPTNASRTLLVSLASLDWDDELLALFGVPRDVLPQIVPSSGVVGETDLFGATLPIAGMAGDQQAALFGQACFGPGRAKATYGTGSFVLAHTGGDCSAPPHGLLRTAAARTGAPSYALEGAIFATGAAVQWLRDGLGLIASADETAALAASVPDNGGVYFVPALTGLGSPHWNADARGLITGITRGTGRAHIARAALEAIALQTRDVVDAMPTPLDTLRADGGATENAFLMQLQADVLGVPVEVARERETTALGAAALAGLALGVWRSTDELEAAWRPGARYEPRELPGLDELREGWRAAVARTIYQ